MSITCEQSVVNAVQKAIPADTPFRVRVLQTRPEPEALYKASSSSPSSSTSSATAHSWRTLVLCSVCCGDNDGENNSAEVMLAGMEVVEYRHIGPDNAVAHTICIEKVDISGHKLSGAGSVAAQMVRGFLSYHTGCFTKSADETGNGDGYSTLMVYLMARGLPEFLFGRSKANPDKKTLSDSGLISWWHHVLSSSFVDSGFASGVTMSKHWLVPGLDESEAKRLLSSQTSASQKWNYNLPYNPTDLARKVVPSFPDDAKSRLLSKPEARSWTVAEMLQMMEHSEEFASGRRAGLFVVNVSSPASNDLKAAPLSINFKYRPPHLDMSEQQRDAFRICMFDWEIDFSNERANKESSAKIIRHIVNKFGGYNGALAKGEYIRKTAAENGTAATDTATAKTVAPVANVLQVRSKRKAKPSDAEPATSKPKLD